MKVLITGAGGQLGRKLVATAPAGMEIRAPTRDDLDITDTPALRACIDRFAPALVINAAAYTAVDRAESEPERAFAVNAHAPAELAAAAARQGARMIHVSTDFVFDGVHPRPYMPTDTPRPLNVYGETKLAGERAVREALGERSLIVRTSWLYAAHGHNFVNTMLRLMREKSELRVVSDQIGTPTSVAGLARALWAAAVTDAGGILHWSDAGVASWYDFAVAIGEEALAAGLLDHTIPVRPIASSEYPTPARRPACVLLDKRAATDALGLEPVHWRRALRDTLTES